MKTSGLLLGSRSPRWLWMAHSCISPNPHGPAVSPGLRGLLKKRVYSGFQYPYSTKNVKGAGDGNKETSAGDPVPTVRSALVWTWDRGQLTIVYVILMFVCLLYHMNQSWMAVLSKWDDVGKTPQDQSLAPGRAG